MSTDPAPRTLTGNRLLVRLSDEDFARFRPHLQPIPLPNGRVIHDEWQRIAAVYFLTCGAVSALVATADGHSIEAANIGREGACGVGGVLDLQPSVHKMVVQIAGEALRIGLEDLRRVAEPGGRLHGLLLRYFAGFLSQASQSVACNGLHGVKHRCCR